MFWSKKRIYLDYAAGAEGNPSSVHAEGRAAKARLEAARVHVARLVEAKTDDVVFTSGATEANAIAILGLLKPGDHYLYLPSAHASIAENAKLAESRGVSTGPLPIRDGRVDIEALKLLIRPETTLVSMEAVCGETGTVWNTREVANVLKRSQQTTSEGLNWPSGRSASSRGSADVALHVDASQAAMSEKLSRAHHHADLLVYDGAKLGIAGAGCLIAHRTIPLVPIYGGGGQERGLRSGTQNVAAIEQFAQALTHAAQGREAFVAYTAKLHTQLAAGLERIPNVYINVGREASPNILNISLPGRDTDYLAVLLDEVEFAVSTKSACESLSGEGSRAVLALTGDPARAASTLRMSFGFATSPRDISRFAAALAAAIHFIDTASTR